MNKNLASSINTNNLYELSIYKDRLDLKTLPYFCFNYKVNNKYKKVAREVKKFLEGKLTKHKVLELNFDNNIIHFFEVYKEFDCRFIEISFNIDYQSFRNMMKDQSDKEIEDLIQALLKDRYVLKIRFNLIVQSSFTPRYKRYTLANNVRNKTKLAKQLKEILT